VINYELTDLDDGKDDVAKGTFREDLILTFLGFVSLASLAIYSLQTFN